MSELEGSLPSAPSTVSVDAPATRRVRSPRWWLKPVIGMVAVTIILLAAPLYGRFTAGGKISADIDRSAEQVNVTVDLPFPPENYHRDTLSELGVFAGRDRSDETKLRLRAVSQSDLDKISRLFWVEGIEPTVGR